jgi:glycerol-3-phosphate O-acyltransferase
MPTGPLAPYDPNPILAALYRRFFQHIEVDPDWMTRIRDAEARGLVIYVMRNLSFVDFLALDYLTKRHGLPQVRFVNDTGLFLLEPLGRGWWHAIARTASQTLGPGALAGVLDRPWDDATRLRSVLDSGTSAALFLKRPPSVLGPGSRGRIEGDAVLRTVLEAAGSSQRPILLCPQTFIWSRGPDRAVRAPLDMLFGPREWPGKLRTVAQFLANYRHVTLRAGEPLDVSAFVTMQRNALPDGVRGKREHGESGGGAEVSSDALIRRMTYALLRRLERERKAVTGPRMKPADRVREEVVRSPKLQRIIKDLGGPSDAGREVISARAREMVGELEAAVDETALAILDRTIDATISRMYESFEVDQAGLRRLQQVAKTGTLVLLPSHKSHVDYLILSHIFYRAKMPVPLVAAGDNLNFFPLGPIFRKSGAFFIRRKFHGDRLYIAVVDAYMRRLMKEGSTLEFFLEGGRSRTGKLLSPKLGLLSMVVDAALGTTSKPVYFCPISIGYERMVEEHAYVDEVSGGEKAKEDMGGLLRTASVLTRQYGRISVQFGEPLTLFGVAGDLGVAEGAELSPSKRRALITRLGHWVMNEINRISAVTPGALVATVLLAHEGRAISHAALLVEATRLADFLRKQGARFSPSLFPANATEISKASLITACTLFHRAGHLTVASEGQTLRRHTRLPSVPGDGAFYSIDAMARLSLDQAKNTIIHFFVARAFMATALLSEASASATGRNAVLVSVLRERTQTLSRLFKYEFIFRTDAAQDRLFDETLSELGASGELLYVHATEEGASVRIMARPALLDYAAAVKNFVEGYRILARTLAALVRSPLSQKELVKRALSVGVRMFLDGAIERREAVVSPLFENAILAFIDQGFLRRIDGKIGLAESFATEESVKAIEAKVTHFLVV